MHEPPTVQSSRDHTDRPSLNQHRPSRFLSLRDVLDRLTISHSLLYELIKDPVQPIPTPVHIGRRSVWVEQEIEEYMAKLIASERD